MVFEKHNIELPWPPSVNHYWVYRRVKNRICAFIGPKGTLFRKDAITAVMLQNANIDLAGKLKVSITAYPPNKIRRDLDNLFKGILDAMQHAGVYKDDSQIDDLRIKRGEVYKPGGKIIVELQRIEIKENEKK